MHAQEQGQDLMTVLHDSLKNEPPIPNPARILAEGTFGALMGELGKIQRQINRERTKAAHDANLRYNHMFCRKKCKRLFKERKCYLKSYEEQCKCVAERGYEKPEVLTPEVVN